MFDIKNHFKTIPGQKDLLSIFPEGFESREFIGSLYGGHIALVNRALDENNVRLTGLLHLGGHAGQELAVWHLLGARRIFVVEPQSHMFDLLNNNANALTNAMSIVDGFERKNPKLSSGVKVLRAAVSDKNTQGVIKIHEHDKESSLLHSASDSVTGIKNEEPVEIVTIETILDKYIAPWDPKDFNGLWMNIQGSELKALKGANDYIRQFEFIMLEINFVKRYVGCPEPQEIYEFLEYSGFSMFSSYRFHDDYGYAIYTQNRQSV